MMNKYKQESNNLDFRNPQDVFNYSRLFVQKNFGYLHQNIKSLDTYFYRSRLHSTPNTLYANYSELMSPPKNVCPLGRANFPGEPVFYASDKISTTIAECKPQIGQFISTIELRITKDEIVTMIIGRTNRYPEIIEEMETESRIFNDYLDECFIANVLRENQLEYYRTATFIRTQIPNLLMGNADTIIYPSMASKLKGDNFVFTQDFIDKHGKFISLIVSEIIDKDAEGNYITKCIFKSYNLTTEKDFVYGRILNCEGHNFIKDEYH